jgi:hypothetical protein
MAKAWKDVIQSPEYNALTPSDKAAAQNQYFNEVVAPNVPEEQIDAVFNQFTSQYPLANELIQGQASPIASGQEVSGQPTSAQNIAQSVAQTDIVPSQVSGAVTGLGETINQMVGSLAGLSLGGIETLAKAPFVGLDRAILEGKETTTAISDLVAPKTEQGKAIAENVATALSQLGKIPAGWGGIAKLVGGGSVQSAVDTVKEIEQKGLPKFAGDVVLDKTGSPLLATITEASPIAASLFFPVKSIAGKVGEARKVEAIDKLNKLESIKTGVPVDDIAKYKAVARQKWDTPTNAEVAALSEKLELDPVFARAFAEKLPKLERNKSFSAAVKQEWDVGALNTVATGSTADLNVMKKMLSIYKEGAKNPEFKVGNRPIFEAGRAIDTRVKFLLAEKRIAGARVESAAKSLRGVNVRHESIIDNFVKNLENEGVAFNGGAPITDVKQYNKIDFRQSLFDGSEASENVLRKAISRMTEKDFQIDAFNLHNLKKSLPVQISTAKKTQGGLVQKAELELNNLRRNINDLLRDTSKDYRAANDDFRTAIEPLNKLNDAMPRNSKIDWEGINPDKAGLQVRKMLSNYSNAVDLTSAVKSLDAVSRQLGGNFNDDVIKQAVFAINLDKRLGAFADTSLQGISESAGRSVIGSVPVSTTDAAIKGLGAAMRKIKRVDNERAIASMESFLDELKRGNR